MRIVVNEKQYKILNESFKSNNVFASFIREQLKSIYLPLGKYGKLPNPDDNCQTNDGVFDVFPHSEQDKWSILNRFDTNSKVRTKMENIFIEENPDTPMSYSALTKWIEDNKYDLLGPDGKYTQSLVDINQETITKGNENEEYAVEILKNKFPDYKIKRFCTGDIRDTKKGIDIAIEKGKKSYHVQVKPYISIHSYVEPDGDTFFEVKSYLNTNKYSDRNVHIFMFVSSYEDKFILFSNQKNKINQMRNNITRFYEPPLYKNFDLKTELKEPNKKGVKSNEIFDQDNEILSNLYFRKKQIEKLIRQQLKKIKENDKKNN